MSCRTFSAVSLFCVVAACDEPGERSPQDDVGMPYCEETATPMSPADVSSLGISGQQLLDGLPAELLGAATFVDGTIAELDVQLDVDVESLRFVASQVAVPDTDGPIALIAIHCADYLAVDAQVQIFTADGRLAESIEVVMRTENEDMVDSPTGAIAFHAALEADELMGSIDLADFIHIDRYDVVQLNLVASIQDGAFDGAIEGIGEEVHGNTISAMWFDVAQLSAAISED